jgi:hypothetical protein
VPVNRRQSSGEAALRKTVIRLFVSTWALCWAGGGLLAQERPYAAFGGFALASYGSDRESLISSFPIAARLVLCSGKTKSEDSVCAGVPSTFQSDVSKTFANVGFQYFDIKFDMFDNNDLEGLVLVPLVSREALVSANEGLGYSYSYRVFADLMLLRFRPGEVQFVAAVPFILNYFDIQPRPLSQDQIDKVFFDLYTNRDLGFNFFEEIAHAAQSKLKVPDEKSNYAQIVGVNISDEVAEILQQSYPVDTWRQQIAQFFSANVVETTGAILLPSRLSSEVTDRLSIVFSDANRRVNVPVPNYEIHIDLERFVRHEQDEGAEKIICFIVAARLRVIDGFGDEKGNIRFVRSRDSCGATKKGVLRPDKMYFPESMFSLLTGVATQFGERVEKNFLESHVEDPREALLTIQKIKQLAFGGEVNN